MQTTNEIFRREDEPKWGPVEENGTGVGYCRVRVSIDGEHSEESRTIILFFHQEVVESWYFENHSIDSDKIREDAYDKVVEILEANQKQELDYIIDKALEDKDIKEKLEAKKTKRLGNFIVTYELIKDFRSKR